MKTKFPWDTNLDAASLWRSGLATDYVLQTMHTILRTLNHAHRTTYPIPSTPYHAQNTTHTILRTLYHAHTTNNVPRATQLVHQTKEARNKYKTSTGIGNYRQNCTHNDAIYLHPALLHYSFVTPRAISLAEIPAIILLHHFFVGFWMCQIPQCPLVRRDVR